MTATAADTARDLYAKIVPAASRQTVLAAEALLHSANAGAVVAKVGQARSELRSQARVFAREVAKHVNDRQAGEATAFVYEESFGTEDRLHFLIHLRSIETYYSMVEMGDRDQAYRESLQAERVDADQGGGAWDRLYVDGTVRSTVMLPLAAPDGGDGLNSATAGIVLHRTGQVAYGARDRARAFARDLASRIGAELPEEASAVAFEEAFGAAERLHWLVHLRDLTSYSRLVALEAFAVPGDGVFVPGSVTDVALTPHHWGLYGTREA